MHPRPPPPRHRRVRPARRTGAGTGARGVPGRVRGAVCRGMLLLGLALATPAAALGLPVGLPPVPDAVGTVDPLVRDTAALARERLERVQSLLRVHRRELEADPRGAPVVRGELLAIDPSPGAVQALREAGFRVREERALEPLGVRVLVLEPPGRQPLRRALRQLRRIDPDGRYDYNHLYLGAAPVPGARGAAAPAWMAVASATAPMAAGTEADAPLVGLVDGGVDAALPAFAGRDLRRHGCPSAAPDPHGTAVAALLLQAPRLRLRAADIYCGEATGGAVTRLADALAWLAGERATVINLSLVGPPNALMEALVARLQQRGHVLVAAVGNDGPAAPPLYPAAYPGVIGVAAVDARGRPLPESGRGAHVDIAANGLFALADAKGRARSFRGTSFAAPRVARRAALLLPAGAADRADATLRALAAESRDAGPRGRDARFGEGVLGDEAPAR